MVNYKITIAYDGTKYRGWQVLGDSDLTIQGKLQDLLGKLTGQPVEVIGSGRTDAGVHAACQVANFHVDNQFSKEAIMEAFERYLTEDIAVTSIEEVDDRFHARYNAVSKTYRYRIHNGKTKDVFARRYVYHYEQPLDMDAMRKAASYLLGTHDFRSFCGNKKMKKSTVRTITDITISKVGDEIVLDYTGDGFLQNMIRILTGTLIEVGDGRRAATEIPEILAALDRQAAGYTAPPQGLILMGVTYD